MGYYSAKRLRKDRERPVGALEILFILLVVAAIVGLIAWIIVNAGGGHFVT